MTRRGFSLIELVVVIVLLAMIAAIASLSLRGYVAKYRLTRAAETIAQFDLSLRREARRVRASVAGTIDPTRRRLAIRSGTQTRAFQLPSAIRITAVRIGRVASSTSRRQVPVDGIGASPSYAVELSSGAVSRWMFFSGGCGQCVPDLDREQVVALLETS